MGKIAVMMSVDRPDAPLSDHFGKAEWIMITDAQGATPKFVKNEERNGRSVTGLLLNRKCTDVILHGIGEGPLRYLQAANIHVWFAPSSITSSKAVKLFAERKLPRVSENANCNHDHDSGCYCSGQGTAKMSSCCRG